MAQINGISYKKIAGNPTLVFIHGWVHNYSIWTRIQKKIHCGALLIDLLGHGKSSAPKQIKEYSIAKQAETISKIISKEVKNSCIIVGHSLGGMIAQEIYNQIPNKISALILIDTADSAPLTDTFIHKIVSLFLKKTKTKTHKKRFIDLSKKTKTTELQSWIEGASNTEEFAWLASLKAMMLFKNKKLRQIKCPTLVMCGEQDIRTPNFIARKMASTIKDSKLIILNGVGHNAPLTHPVKIAKVIQEYIRNL